MDACNVDLKAFTERFYRQICLSHLEPVLDTLRYLKHETDVWFEITNLVIPGENDSSDEIEAMTRWVVDNLGVDVPMHFSAFHPDWKMIDKPRTPPQTLLTAWQIARDAGVRYVYTGNIHHPETQATLCHACGALLIGRDWYDLGVWALSHDGRCNRCGVLCAGRFDGPPGQWGRKRQPLRLSTMAELAAH